MTPQSLAAAFALGLVLAIVLFLAVTSYNAVMALRQRIDKAWSNIDVVLKQRYDQLLPGDRFTLPAAFQRAGWRTVVDVPSNRDPWPEGRAFYRFDVDYDRHDVGYEGPKFSFAAIPDQYTLAAFQRMELAPGHAPVMAEIDLVSSHEPWTPLPRLLAYASLVENLGFD